MTDIHAQLKAEIQARVYRAKPKPKGIPVAIWKLLPRWITHKAENLGTVASSDMGNVTITR